MSLATAPPARAPAAGETVTTTVETEVRPLLLPPSGAAWEKEEGGEPPEEEPTTAVLFGLQEAQAFWDARKGLSGVLRALRDRDDSVRLTAATTLGLLDVAAGVGPLIRTLRDPNRAVRDAAVRALGQIGSEAAHAAGALLDVVFDPTEAEGIRADAVWALAQGRHPMAVHFLRQALRLHQPIQRADGQLTSVAMPPAVRAQAAWALGQVVSAASEAAAGTLADLGRALTDPDQAVRLQAVKALGQVGAALADTPATSQRAPRRPTVQVTSKKPANVFLPQAGPSWGRDNRGFMGQTVPEVHVERTTPRASAPPASDHQAAVRTQIAVFLIQALSDSDNTREVRFTALSALLPLGGEAARAAVTAVVTDADPDLRQAATEALQTLDTRQRRADMRAALQLRRRTPPPHAPEPAPAIRPRPEPPAEESATPAPRPPATAPGTPAPRSLPPLAGHRAAAVARMNDLLAFEVTDPVFRSPKAQQALREALNLLGYRTLRDFQAASGLPTTGRVNQATSRNLHERLGQIALAAVQPQPVPAVATPQPTTLSAPAQATQPPVAPRAGVTTERRHVLVPPTTQSETLPPIPVGPEASQPTPPGELFLGPEGEVAKAPMGDATRFLGEVWVASHLVPFLPGLRGVPVRDEQVLTLSKAEYWNQFLQPPYAAAPSLSDTTPETLSRYGQEVATKTARLLDGQPDDGHLEVFVAFMQHLVTQPPSGAPGPLQCYWGCAQWSLRAGSREDCRRQQRTHRGGRALRGRTDPLVLPAGLQPDGRGSGADHVHVGGWPSHFHHRLDATRRGAGGG